MACQNHRQGSEFLPLKFRHAFTERAERRDLENELGPAYCPKCNFPLALLLRARGPEFVCGCPKHREKKLARG